MKNKLATIVVMILLTVIIGAALAPTRVQITILSTTDLHGNILPYDYYTERPDNRGIAKVGTLIKQIRKENPNTLLLDSGDTIQGTPLEYIHNKVNNAPADPMMLAMNALHFDAMTVGNHEYNYGLKVLEKAHHEAQFPWLSANTYKKGTNQPAYDPYIVKVIGGVRVGILGLTTPCIPDWDDPANYAGLEFRETVSEAKKWVPVLREQEHVDLVVVALHQGLEEDLATGLPTPSDLKNENAALTIARQVPGIDLMLLGHTHRDLPSLSVNGVLLTQADSWGRRLARADIYLEKDETNVRWHVAAKAARTIPVDNVTPDEELSKIADPYDREAKTFLARVIGESKADLTAADARFQDTAIMDLIQHVQMEAGNADVSMAAPFNLRARIPKGPVTVRDIAGLYIYDNTLVVLEITGQQLKDALEHSAKFFLPYVPGKKPSELVDSRIPTFNFDIAEGIDYDLDVSRPVGQRIQNMRFHGQPLTMTQKLKLAVNNYRVNGGGGYTMYKNAPIVFRSSEEIREMIVEWVERHKEIPSDPSNNWRLLPR